MVTEGVHTVEGFGNLVQKVYAFVYRAHVGKSPTMVARLY